MSKRQPGDGNEIVLVCNSALQCDYDDCSEDDDGVDDDGRDADDDDENDYDDEDVEDYCFNVIISGW